MNIREFHIEVSQATQNIASNTRRKLQQEELDWVLNKNLERFIASKVKLRKDGSGGFQIDQLEADAIRTLLKEKELTPEQLSDGSCRAHLPCDYQYLISDESKVEDLCGTAFPTATSLIETVRIFEMPDPIGKGTPTRYFVPLTYLRLNDSDYVLTDTLRDYYGTTTFEGLVSKDEKYMIRDLWLSHMRDVLGLDVYWERYRGYYRRNTFMAPQTIVGEAIASVDSKPGKVESRTCTYKVFEDGGSWINNRLTPASILPAFQATPFYKSTVKSPISSLEPQYLKVHGDKSFTVTGVRVNYVKKPRRMSLALGQDCELPETSHQALCDLTVEYVKLMYTDPNWEAKMRDNLTRQPNL